MFYAHFVLAKKGPLARIWLAAHWDKKLTKAHVFETNIEQSVDGILQPKVKMALRTSGHLLVGVVRIYSRKAKYLLQDCNEAFVKIKMAFRPGMVDLPDDIREAAVSAITFPEVFHDFDTAMPELNDVDIQAQFTLNQSRAEEITMREDYGNISLVPGDDGFGELSFEEPPELMRATSGVDQTLEPPNLMFEENTPLIEKQKEDCTTKIDETQLSTTRADTSALDIDAPLRDDGFGGNLGQDIMTGGLFEGGLFDDAPIGEGPSIDEGQPEKDTQVPEVQEPPEPVALSVPPELSDDDDDDDGQGIDQFGGPPSVAPPSSENGSPPASPSKPEEPVPDIEPEPVATVETEPEPIQPTVEEDAEPVPSPGPFEPFEPFEPDEPPEPVEPVEPVEPPGPVPEEPAEETLPGQEQETLLQNEAESFALEPVDASAIKSGWPRAKRKRKLIVDEVKNISGEEMKAQLSDTTDIGTTLDLAPPTKRLMHWKETGGVEKLYALPGCAIHARTLSNLHQRHLTSKASLNEDFGMAGDKELENLSLEQVRDTEDPDGLLMPKPRGRPPKRKHTEHDDEDEVVVPTRVTRSRDTHAPNYNQDSYADPSTPAPATPLPDMLSPDTPAPATPLPDFLSPDTPAPATPAPDTPAPDTPAPATPINFDDLHPPDTIFQPPITPAAPPDTPQPPSPQPQLDQTQEAMDEAGKDILEDPFSVPPPSIAPPSVPPLSVEPAGVMEGTEIPAFALPSVGPPSVGPPSVGPPSVAPPSVGPPSVAPPTPRPHSPQMDEEEQMILTDQQTIADPPHTVDTPQVQDDDDDAAAALEPQIATDVEPQTDAVVTTDQQQTAEDDVLQPESELPPCDADADIDHMANLGFDQEPTEELTDQMPHDDDLPPPTPTPTPTPGPDVEPPRPVHSDHPHTPSRVEEDMEEQADDETYEEFEERVVNKRAGLLFHQIKKRLRTQKIALSQLVVNNTRKQVVQKFYTMLVLKKLQAVELKQDGAFTEIFIERGTLFENAKL